ncbi:MAG: thiamine phosphate synthase [Acidobacteria bacterium]|nr:thiamine phosphate synthase [Acidobacteriota bacterium]
MQARAERERDSAKHQVSAAAINQMKPLSRLYAIADASFGDPVSLAQALFDGGARLVQVRNKKDGAGELLRQVERILALAPPDGLVIVNDRVDVARIAGAAGVHLGQSDLPVRAARPILGPDRIVGLSTHNLDQALEADKLPVDYVAVGPVFPTASKENAEPVVGIDNLAVICQSIRKPVVAIGGIKIEDAHRVLRAGARSIAVISDLLNSRDIPARVKAWSELLGV